ncbi:DNA recombination protein RmuC [Ancylobacter terrae]|uniref:DNA recombination protein RmuC n=1 Tax=Ancylobacter sp. sgz301288 TaxID=3342077 RepID=UPI00385B3BB6
MEQPITVIAGHTVTLGHAALAGIAAGAVLALLLLLALARGGRARALEAQLVQLARVQAETAGRVQSMAEVLAQRQGELARAVAERLDATSHRMGESLARAAQATHADLVRLNERLALVDQARESLGDLSSQVISLRETLANKQARGAFGEGRLHAIVADGLPRGTYAFQHTLSNGRRADCAVFLPGDARPLLVDSKFPLEAITAFREAGDAGARKQAQARLKQDVGRHIGDIAERYLVPGETQDVALMFVPSESVYAELHEHFDEIIQRAFRARVVLVSPSLLMLAIQVVQAIVKDARMREQADRIRAECGALVADAARLRERVAHLGRHLGQANEDVAQILVSADRIARRGARVEQLEFEAPVSAARAAEPGDDAAMPAPLGLKLGAAE